MSITSIPFSAYELMPQEEKLLRESVPGKLFIGLPKESSMEEKRVCLTPDAVESLVAHGHEVWVEEGAGVESSFEDDEYRKAGATITVDRKKIFSCPLVFKVSPPTMDEIGMMQTGSALISALQLKTIDLDYINALKSKKITAIALEYLTDEDGSHPMTQSLGEIAGISSVHIATELMSQTHHGKGQLFGNISGLPPTEVVVFGAGTAATAAAKTALELGAQVKVFDHSVARLRRLQNQLKHPISTSILDPKNMVKALRRCDVAIGALWGKSRAPIVVSESMTSVMKKGAVIVDIAIDSGGCFETSEVTTHDQPTQTKYGVIHYGVPNIPARYPKTASLSMSHICLPLLLHISDQGGVPQSVKNHEGFRSGVYLYRGILTHQTVADWWGITYTPIELLLV